MNFSSQIFFNVINHGYRQSSYIKEEIFVAVSILCGVATYFYYEKMRRMMRTAILSNLLQDFFSKCDHIRGQGRPTKKNITINL